MESVSFLFFANETSSQKKLTGSGDRAQISTLLDESVMMNPTLFK